MLKQGYSIQVRVRGQSESEMLGVAAQLLDVSISSAGVAALRSSPITVSVAMQTLEYMHIKVGLVHSDISCSNLLLHCDADSKNLTFIDFGHAQEVDPGK